MGGLDTLTKSIASPPTVTRRSALRGVIVKLLRRLADLLHDEAAVHANALRIHVDVAAGILENLQRLPVQEQDADLFEDAHRAVVDALDPLLIKRFDRPVAVFRNRPGDLVDGRRAGALTIAGAPPRAAPAPLLELVSSWLAHRPRSLHPLMPITGAH